MLTFTNRQGRDIGESNPQDADSVEILDDKSIIIHPAIAIPGVDETTDSAKIAGVWTRTLMLSPQEWTWTPMCGPLTLMSLLMIMLFGYSVGWYEL